MARNNIKEIHLKYAVEDFDKLKKIKDFKNLTWEDLMFLSVINFKGVKG